MPLGESISYYKDKLPAREDITTIHDILGDKETSGAIEPFKEEQAPTFTPEIAIEEPIINTEIVEEIIEDTTTTEEIPVIEEFPSVKKVEEGSPFEHNAGIIKGF